jgi:hypothetical protein
MLFINPPTYINKFILVYSLINSILKNKKSTGKIGDFYRIFVIIFFIILVFPLNITDMTLSDRKFII